MSPERHPLDLNHLPEECGRDVKQVPEESSSSGNRRKKSDPKNGDNGKAYECRFCSLKFCKSQALGGHMNRHRQERETETLNQARQLVYSNENLATQGVPRLGYRDLQSASMNSSLPFGSVYPTKLFPVSSSSILPPSFPEPNLYSSSSCFAPFPNHYPTPSTPLHPFNVLPSINHGNPNQNLRRTAELLSYTCTGASLGSGFPSDDRVKSVRQTMDLSASALGEGAVGSNWCRSNGGRGAQQQILDPSSINLFQDDKFKM